MEEIGEESGSDVMARWSVIRDLGTGSKNGKLYKQDNYDESYQVANGGWDKSRSKIKGCQIYASGSR